MPKTAEVIRSDTRRDLLFFGLPAVVVFSLGLVVCARDGFYEGIVSDLFDAVTYRDSGLLSAAQIGGVVFFSVGLITMVVAQATLKRSYSGTLVVRSDHQLPKPTRIPDIADADPYRPQQNPYGGTTTDCRIRRYLPGVSGAHPQTYPVHLLTLNTLAEGVRGARM